MGKGKFDKNKYVADYKRDHYYHMVSMLPPEYKEIVKTRSESLGLSMTQYIKSLVDADCGITPDNVNAPDQ